MSWNAIDCNERNGVITSYHVDFYQVGANVISITEVVGETFTASSLQPISEYTFRVAGVNIAGSGPFTDAITISTLEDGMFLMRKVTQLKDSIKNFFCSPGCCDLLSC